MSHLKTMIRVFPVTGFAAMLSACQPINSGSVEIDSNGLSLAPPAVVANARNVNRDALSPLVRLNDGRVIDMVQQGELWTGQVLVEPDNTFVVSIEWREALPQGALPLATLDRTVFVGPNGEVVQNVAPGEYSTNLDNDVDGFTNLFERENNSDPFSGNSIPVDDNGSPVPAPEPVEPIPAPQPVEPIPAPEPEEETEPTDTETPEPETVDPTPDPVELPIPEPETPPETEEEPEEEEEEEEEETEPEEIPEEEIDEEVDEEEGTVDPTTVLIPRILAANAPDIDGMGATELAADGSLVGEWSAAVQFDDNGVRLGINNFMIDSGGTEESDGDPHRRWAAMHDGTRVYVLVIVDDVGLRFGDSDEIWEDDSVELFIDGDNSKLATWGDDDDFQFLIPMLTVDGDANISSERRSRFIAGRQSSTDSIDLEFATGPGIGPDGIRITRFEQDVYELSFDIDDAGITIGDAFGFELQINDDDNGGARDGKWGWFHPSRQNDVDTDTSFENPSVMGTVVLGQ